MSGSLKADYIPVWEAIKAKVEAALAGPSPRLAVNEFNATRRQKSPIQKTPALYVLDRRLESEDVGTHRSLASLTVTFGVTETSFRQTTQSELESIALDLAEIFLEDPKLGELVNDTNLVTIEPDAVPFADEATELWSTVTLSWVFDYIRS